MKKFIPKLSTTYVETHIYDIEAGDKYQEYVDNWNSHIHIDF